MATTPLERTPGSHARLCLSTPTARRPYPMAMTPTTAKPMSRHAAVYSRPIRASKAPCSTHGRRSQPANPVVVVGNSHWIRRETTH